MPTGVQELPAYRIFRNRFSENPFMPWEKLVPSSSLAVGGLPLRHVFRLCWQLQGGLLVSSHIQKWFESVEEFFSCLSSEVSQEPWKFLNLLYFLS